MAPFTDGGRTIDRTNWFNSYISHTCSAVSPRWFRLSRAERSNGKTTLDDFMRAMWRTHGKLAPPRPATLAQPYTIDDAEREIAEVMATRRSRISSSSATSTAVSSQTSALLAPAGLLVIRLSIRAAPGGRRTAETRTGLLIADTPRSDSADIPSRSRPGRRNLLTGWNACQPDRRCDERGETAQTRRQDPVEYVDRGGT